MYICKICGWTRQDEPKETWEVCPNCDSFEWMREGERNDRQWTTEPPTKEGWYWVYFLHEKHPDGPRLVEVEWHMSGYLGISNGDYLESLDEYSDPVKGYWLGPLPVPEPPKE